MAVEDVSTQARVTAADRCPFARPFPPGFADCPAYQRSTFTAADSMNRVLGDHLTCLHLAIGRNPPDPGGFYGRCGLGTEAERLRWVAEVRPERVAGVRAISAELERLNSSRRQQLFVAKSALLASPADANLRTTLDDAVAGYMAALREFAAEHEAQLAAVGLPGPQLLELIEEWISRWSRTRDMAAVAPDPELLAGFDGPVQALLGGANSAAQPDKRED